MKKIILIILSFLTVYGHAQIIENESSNKEAKKPKKEKAERQPREKSGVELFFGVSPAYTFRTIAVNEGIFAQPLGTKEFEKANWTVGYHAGARTKITNFLKLEFGGAYYSNKESFAYETADSVYNYTNTYQHIAVPIRVAYTFGKDISFYGGIGIVPKAFLSMKREVTTLDPYGKEQTEKTRVRDNFNLFQLDGVVTVGTQLKFNRSYGIYAMVEGRRQLTNNFVKQAPYVRKGFELGFHVGIEIYL